MATLNGAIGCVRPMRMRKGAVKEQATIHVQGMGKVLRPAHLANGYIEWLRAKGISAHIVRVGPMR